MLPWQLTKVGKLALFAEKKLFIALLFQNGLEYLNSNGQLRSLYVYLFLYFCEKKLHKWAYAAYYLKKC